MTARPGSRNPHYERSLLILLALTGLSYGMAHVSLGRLGVPVALVIAGTKISVVLTRFMHVRRETTTAGLGLLVALGMVSLLIGFMCLETMTRATFSGP